MKKKEMLKALDELIKDSKELEEGFSEFDDYELLINAFDSWLRRLERLFLSYFYNIDEKIANQYYHNVSNLGVKRLKGRVTDHAKTLEIRRYELIDIREEIARDRVPQLSLKLWDYIKNIIACLSLPAIVYIILHHYVPDISTTNLVFELLIFLIASVFIFFPDTLKSVEKYQKVIQIIVTLIGLITLILNIK